MTARGPRPELAALLAAFCLLNALALWQGWNPLLEYRREAVLDGQWWRLLTGHLVHLGWRHFLLNLVGLLLLWSLARAWLAPGRALAALALGGAVISAALLLLHPEVAWYRGLSGALHALWAAAAIAGLRRRDPLALALAALLLAKTAWEAASGLPATGALLASQPVLLLAHWYGILGGLIGAIPSHADIIHRP